MATIARLAATNARPTRLVFKRTFWWNAEKSVTPSIAQNVPPSVAPTSIPTLPASLPTPTEPIVTPTGTNVTETVTDGIPSAFPPPSLPPLEYGDLADLGLASWSPAGLFRWTLEIIQTGTGMPWFYALVAGTAAWRIALVYPTLRAARAREKMRATTPLISPIMEQIKAAQKQKDTMTSMRLSREVRGIYKAHGVKLGDTAIGLIQLPAFIGMIWGVRTMVHFPIEQLKYSGVQWLPDLTALAGSGYTLPVFTASLTFFQLQALVKETDFKQNPTMGHAFNLMRFASPALFFAYNTFTNGVLLVTATSIIFQTAQSYALRVPAIRTRLDLPKLAPVPVPTVKESIQFIMNRNEEIAEEITKRALSSQRLAEKIQAPTLEKRVKAVTKNARKSKA